MRYRKLIIALLILVSIVTMSGCGNSTELTVQITSPTDGAVFRSGTAFNIHVVFSRPINGYYVDLGYRNRNYDGTLGNEVFDFCWSCGTPQTDIFGHNVPQPFLSVEANSGAGEPGVQVLVAMARVPGTGDIPNYPWVSGSGTWVSSAPVRICVTEDGLPPAGWPPICTLPTPTPVTPVIIRPNPHNPGGTNPSGCAAFTDQTSCNLAGCSWNYGSCTVNP